MTQSFEVHARSARPPEAVWARLADIPAWSTWAGPMIRESVLERPGAPDELGVGAIRKLGARPVYSREEIVEFEPPRHMAYVLRSGLPGVRNYRADVDLTPTDDGGTAVRWRSSFDAAVPGTGGLLRAFLARTVGGMARRLAG